MYVCCVCVYSLAVQKYRQTKQVVSDMNQMNAYASVLWAGNLTSANTTSYNGNSVRIMDVHNNISIIISNHLCCFQYIVYIIIMVEVLIIIIN